MATRIRLRRTGRRHKPSYRIVVTEKSAPRDGRFIETIGHYNPRTEPVTLQVDADKARDWLSRGATTSDTVRSLLKKAGVFASGESQLAATAPAEPKATQAEAPAEEQATAPPEAQEKE
ncbi:MAG: 30S ribosomal protein S16 [Gemmatimonadetes bacterium]|nr:30S ribosomal protein S16 [Gemmatimonadota bacterium]